MIKQLAMMKFPSAAQAIQSSRILDSYRILKNLRVLRILNLKPNFEISDLNYVETAHDRTYSVKSVSYPTA